MKTDYTEGTSTPQSVNQHEYRALSDGVTSIPLFSRGWWLDAVAGPDDWDVSVVREGGQIVAAMPYIRQRKYGLSVSLHPPLTQTLGPWFREAFLSSGKHLDREKSLMDALIQELPPFRVFSQRWNYEVTNWLPFYWRGFTQTTKYTYLLSDITDPDAVWKGLAGRIRREIRKAQGRSRLSVGRDEPVDVLYQLVAVTFARQGLKPPFGPDVLRRVAHACLARGRGRIYVARDSDGVAHAGCLVAWDDRSAYYVIGGSDTRFRNSGGSSLCMWEAIRDASSLVNIFDFEGSMIESVERYFRGFGAVQTPYHAVRKTEGRLATILFSWLNGLRS